MAEVEKVYCCDRPNDNSAMLAALMNKGNDCGEMAALLNNGMNGQWNNPFIYLVWMMFAQRMWGDNCNHGENLQNNAIQSQLDSMRTQMQDNQNSNLLMDAIKGNGVALNQLAGNLNCDFNCLQNAVCGVKSAIEQVGGAVGFSAERVINAVNLGDANITSKLQSCCCDIRTAIADNKATMQLQMCQDNGRTLGAIADFKATEQLQMCQQTQALRDGQRVIEVAVNQGFATSNYNAERNKNEIIAAGNINTQRMIDTLQQHWREEIQQRYDDARLELSQQRQNAELIAALKPATATTTTAA